MTNTDYDNMSISSEKKDEELEGFVKGKREELKKMIPDFGDKELARIVLNFYERGIRDGICFGMSKQKRQMKSDMLEAEIGKGNSGGKCILSGNFFRFNTGDKVKLIIVKED